MKFKYLCERLNCDMQFSPVETVNVLLSGFVGLILVWIADWLISWTKEQRIKKYFAPIVSKPGVFDWTCYSIQGRTRDKGPNGSTANVRHVRGSELEIKVKEADDGSVKGPIWVGYVRLNEDRARGSLTFKYEGDKYEYQSKLIYINRETENGKTYDYIIMVGDGKVYGTELARRLRR